jgi:sulfite exporter TauE/SafE
MCGALVMALPSQKISSIWYYNIGRLLTYAFLGAIVGMIGFSLNVGQYQQKIAILAGVVVILLTVVPQIRFHITTKFTAFIKPCFAVFLGEKKPFSIFMVGVLNGLLPCGLVYIALAGAAQSLTAWEGGLYMLFFGIGTTPMMSALLFSLRVFNTSLRQHFHAFIPIFSVLIGLLFIIRGLDLGIPYLSPQLDTQTGVAASCYKPDRGK